jgi:glycosyltransferase involved in cell wall biosynthesis
VPDLRLLLAATIAIVTLAELALLVWTRLDTPSLKDVPPVPATPERVSIIVAARDEAPHVRAAMEALLAQDYPDYDVVAVNDRSADETGAILDSIAARDPRLRVVHVQELPDGWLGKNHALHVGAEHADGTLLLFTDGDVVFARDALARAVRLMQVSRVGHLALAVDIICPTWPLALLVNYFMIGFILALRTWRVRDPRSSAYVGIGAFNLVRATAYRAVAGHTRIRMRPDDDLMLGKILKQGGHTQMLAFAEGSVSVAWYHSVAEMTRGLRKNAFAGVHYSIPLTLGVFTFAIVVSIWPALALFTAHGAARAWYGVAYVAQLVGYAGGAAANRNRPWLAPLFPVATVMMLYVFGAAVLRTLVRGGIEWRGTFYPLRALRENRV